MALFLLEQDMDEDQVSENEEEQDEARYRLDSMEISSVGLVPKGANLMPGFILLKHQKEATMPDDVTIEEVTPDKEVTEGFWKRFREEAAGIFKSAQPEPEPEPEVEAPAPQEATPEPEPDPEPEPAPADGLEKLLKAHTEKFEAVLKQQAAEFETRITKMEADLEKAQERAAKAEKYADDQTNKAERQAAIQKALAYKALPAKPADLGEMLYTLEKKLDREEFEQVEALLKAADKQAWTAGLFKEFGTARSAEEVTLEAKVEKIQKEQNISYEEALLSLPEHEQLQLLGEVE